MNRKDLAKEVSDFIEGNIGDNDTDEVNLEEAGAVVSEFIENLDAEDSDPTDDDGDATDDPEKQ